MVITTLVENTAAFPGCGTEHGLSLHIRLEDGRAILFDAGASALFEQNAEKLGVSIADVDFAVLSHGHADHGGGLIPFLSLNQRAKIYAHPLALQKYYADRTGNRPVFIGLSDELQRSRRVIPTAERYEIEPGIALFSNVPHRFPLPSSNNHLLTEQDGALLPDAFLHEQNLVIEEEGKTVLFTGCAHNGILNILSHFQTIKGRMPDVVVGGFHLYSQASGSHEDSAGLDQIGDFLLSTGSKLYTGHCTGMEPFRKLKEKLHEQLETLPTGSVIRI